MANNANKKVKPIYNCEELRIWPMTDEETETYAEDPLVFTKRLMSYDDSVSVNTTELYGDGVIVDMAIDEGAGTLALGIHGLDDDEFSKIYGAENVDGTIIETGEEVPPYCCVALIARTGKNKVNARKWPKVRLSKHTESVQQKQGNTTYSTPTLNGTFVANEKLGIKRARKTGIDTSTAEGKAFIQNWLSQAEFFSASAPTSGSGE